MDTPKKYAYSELKQVGSNWIAFNCPPEIFREWDKAGITPNIIVLGDTPFYQNVPLACLEFPFLNSVFRKGGFDFAKGVVVRPFIVVGDKERVDAHLKALRLAFHGPTHQELRNKLKVSAKVRETILADGQFFAPKDAKGQIVPFEEFVRPVYFQDNRARVGDLEIIRVEKDAYKVVGDGHEYVVALTAEGHLGPAWPIPELRNIATPHQFRVFVLGSDSGFGTGPTTGYVLEFNGKYMLWDVPPYCSATLQYNGIFPDEIFISHWHDDHCNDLVYFALNSYHRIEMIGPAEILHGVQIKLAAMLNMSVERVKSLFRWREIKVGTPFFHHGYRFDFHYGFHPIPSIGVRVTHNDKHCVTISGDTGFGSVIERAEKAGAISSSRIEEILGLLDDGYPTFVDVGEAFIHGAPIDFLTCERTTLFMYHRNGLPENLRQNANLVRPGNAYAVSEMDPKSSDTALIDKVLHQMHIRDWNDWTRTIMAESEVQFAERDQLLIQRDSADKQYFYIIANGIVDVMIGNQVVATLSRGEYFGEQAILENKPRNASIWSRTPVRLIAVPGRVFMEMIEEDRRRAAEARQKEPCAIELLQKIWRFRMITSQIEIFKELPAEAKGQIIFQFQEREFAPGDVILRKGSTTDEVYSISEGKVEIVLNLPGVRNPILGAKDFVGENIALGFADKRTADVVAVEHVRALMLEGKDFLELYLNVPNVHYKLDEIAAKRGVKIA